MIRINANQMPPGSRIGSVPLIPLHPPNSGPESGKSQILVKRVLPDQRSTGPQGETTMKTVKIAANAGLGHYPVQKQTLSSCVILNDVRNRD